MEQGPEVQSKSFSQGHLANESVAEPRVTLKSSNLMLLALPSITAASHLICTLSHRQGSFERDKCWPNLKIAYIYRALSRLHSAKHFTQITPLNPHSNPMAVISTSQMRKQT